MRDVVLVLGPAAWEEVKAFADHFPEARIHLLSTFEAGAVDLPSNVHLTYCAAIVDRASYLARIPRPQIIVENGNNKKGQKLACFRELFPFLAAGGSYIVEQLDAVHNDELDDYPGEHLLQLLHRLVDLRLRLPEAPADEKPGDRELAASIAALTYLANQAHVTKRFDHLVKVRDRAANQLLTERYGARWGAVVETLPSYSWTPVGRAHHHQGAGRLHDRQTITVPERHLRRYDDALFEPRQRLIHGHHYLPDTFRHPQQERLNHRDLVDASAWLARDESPESATPRKLGGSYFFLDTEYPGHFGHVLTEVLSRFWGWERAVALEPGLRPLVSLDPGQTAIPDFQQALFEAIGISTDRVEYVTAGTSARVERLYAATPGFAQPHYVDQALGGLWDRIASSLTLELDTPERIFVSRREAEIRSCSNATEVEAYFAAKGFAVVYPEDHTFQYQVTMFRNARVVAGFGGSAMFSTMFAPGVTKLVISGDAYTANNEFLIAAVVGGDVHYFWGESVEQHPRGSWTWDAFYANFHFEIDSAFDREVEEVLRTLDG